MTPVKKGLAYRISIIILTVISLLAVIEAAANLYISRQETKLDAEINQRLETGKAVQKLHQQFQTVAFAARGYLAFGRESFLEEAMKEKQAYLDAYQQVENLLLNDGENVTEKKHSIEIISKQWTVYVKGLDLASRYFKHPSERAEIETYFKQYGTPAANELNRQMTVLATIQDREIQVLMSQKKVYSNWMLLFPLLLIAGFTATGYYLIRYLRKEVIFPLVRLEQSVMMIGRGEYTSIPLSNRQDELGNLQYGFNQMVNQIKQREQELEMKNLELIDQRDLLEAQNEEIIAQQDEQHATMQKLTEREHELQEIASYQEKLNGFSEYQDFLKHTIPALLDALQLDAAMIVMRERTTEGVYRIDYTCGYPDSKYPRVEHELYGVAQRIFTEKQSFVRTRKLAGAENGLHNGNEKATDYYFPLYDDSQQVTGFLLVTSYSSQQEVNEDKLRLTKGLIRQFSLALVSHLVNEDRFKQRELTQRILESTHEGFVMVNQEGNIVFANRRMEESFKFSRFIGKPYTLFITELNNHKLLEQVESFLSGGSEHLQERFSYQANNESRHFELYANLIKPTKEHIEGYLFVFRDRTEEEQVDELKNEFISIVSHELRTPLATVLGFMEILLHRNVTAEKQRKYMETIYKEANRLSQLINDFLDLQRMESGREVYHFEPVQLGTIVQDVVDMWQNKQSHELRLIMPDQPIYVKGDQDRLKQVVHNLISNAIKYSPSSNQVDVRIYQQEDQVLLDVQDYGLGIPQDATENLFTKFYRVDNSDRRQIGGTGLGLAIVKEILEAHHGAIYFESELGQGTTFTVQLAEYKPLDVGNKIIILEDDENLSKLVGVAFEKLELPVVHLSTAEEAIFSLKQSTDASPLLCIVDIQLGGTKLGWEFIRELHDHPVYTDTPVIVSTVLEPPQNYYQKDKEKYLKKPFTIDRLLELAVELLHNRENRSVYVFPYQDRDSVKSSLIEKGIEVKDVTVKHDIIQVDVKRNDNN